MKPKTLILMVVAVTCGLGASYMTSRLLAGRTPGESEEPVAILVAAKNLDQGLMIKNIEESFVEKPFLAGTEPKDAILKPEELKGKVLKRSLRAGDFITAGDLLSDKDGGIAAMMAQGYRALGVRVNMESTAGGFASLPLSRVDVISTIRRGSDKDSFSQVLLENVLVLAVDTNLSRDAESRAMPGNVVTLALKPDDMLKITMAREYGPLSLALRKFNDHTKSEVDKVTGENIISNTAPKSNLEDSEWTKVTGQPPVASIDVPPLPKTTPKSADVAVAPVEDPKHRVHVLRILEGDQEKRTEYFLDDKGEVIPREVTRTSVSISPPQPAPAVTPPPAPPQPAVPEADGKF